MVFNFCENCNNLLSIKIENNDYRFYCNSCMSISSIIPNDKDTELYCLKNNSVSDNSIKNIIKNVKDPILMKEEIYCDTCKKNILSSYILMRGSLTKINICYNGHIVNS